MESVEVKFFGQVSYQALWDLQKELQKKLIAGEISHTLLVCEHLPVITLGKSAKKENLLFDEESIIKKGIEVFNVERGGDVTFHGPGQLVAYPILNLNAFKRDVGWYMRKLEETVIKTALNFGIFADRVDGRTGVWINKPSNDSVNTANLHPLAPKKMASIGVRLSRWCTMHGVGFNVLDKLEGFSFINPCGFTDIRMTSLKDELLLKGSTLKEDDLFFKEVTDLWIRNFRDVFEVKLNQTNDSNKLVGSKN